MTQGSPLRLIITFALPLMAGNVFQQLYTVVDTAVVGQVVWESARWHLWGLPTGSTGWFWELSRASLRDFLF